MGGTLIILMSQGLVVVGKEMMSGMGLGVVGGRVGTDIKWDLEFGSI